jgi:hypothetical protein
MKEIKGLYLVDDKPSGGDEGGGSEKPTIQIKTKDNLGPAIITIDPGEEGDPGIVIDVERPPRES